MASIVPQLSSTQVLHFRQYTKDFIQLSPCPQVFEYRNDEHGMYGVINVHSNVYKNLFTYRLQVIVFLQLTERIVVDRNIGKLYLLHDNATTLEMVEMHQPIQYRIDFPDYPSTPTVVNITVSGQIICINERSWNINKSRTIKYYYGFLLSHPPDIVLPLNPAMAEVDEKPKQNEFVSSMPLDNGCGKNDNKFRLTTAGRGGGVDGKKIGKVTWPWMVSIYRKTAGGGIVYKCTGTLLSHRIVVSAAHCFVQHNRMIRASVVLFGRHNLHDWIENGLSNVERIEVPDDYLESDDSDIVILISQKFIEYGALIKPICLWSSRLEMKSSDDLTGTIVGWGNPNDDDIINEPHKIQLTIVANDLCLPSSSSNVARSIRSERKFCAESKTANGLCKGDLGKGLAIWHNETWLLRGIISAVIGDPILNRSDRIKYVTLIDISKFSAWIGKWMNKFQ